MLLVQRSLYPAIPLVFTNIFLASLHTSHAIPLFAPDSPTSAGSPSLRQFASLTDNQPPAQTKEARPAGEVAAMIITVLAAGICLLFLFFMASHYNKRCQISQREAKSGSSEKSAAASSSMTDSLNCYPCEIIKQPESVLKTPGRAVSNDYVTTHHAGSHYNYHRRYSSESASSFNKATALASVRSDCSSLNTTSDIPPGTPPILAATTFEYKPIVVVRPGVATPCIVPHAQPSGSPVPSRQYSVIIGVDRAGFYDSANNLSRRSSQWSMSTLGRQLLNDTMHDPEPGRYAIENQQIWASAVGVSSSHT